MKREAVYIAMQPEAENSYWAANISEDIRRAAKDAQLETVTVDLSGELPDIGGRCVLVAGNDTDWLDAALGRLAECGALPIVVNACMLPIQRYRYSGVVFGLEEMLERCLELISLDGRRKTALLGVNPSSVTDRVKADAFSCAAYPCEREIIWSPGRLDECVADFTAKLPSSGFDAVICANDTVAICLLRLLSSVGGTLPESLCIVGMGNSFVGASLGLTSIMFDYRKMGEMSVKLYGDLLRYGASCRITMSLPCELVVRKTAAFAENTAPFCDNAEVVRPKRRYFDGGEVQNIIKVETVMQSVDPHDREILFGIARGENCDVIAEKLFFSDRAVRYRLSNIVRRFGFRDRKELEDALRRALGEK